MPGYVSAARHDANEMFVRLLMDRGSAARSEAVILIHMCEM